jgi:hypothetical protein
MLPENIYTVSFLNFINKIGFNEIKSNPELQQIIISKNLGKSMLQANS